MGKVGGGGYGDDKSLCCSPFQRRSCFPCVSDEQVGVHVQGVGATRTFSVRQS